MKQPHRVLASKVDEREGKVEDELGFLGQPLVQNWEDEEPEPPDDDHYADPENRHFMLFIEEVDGEVEDEERRVCKNLHLQEVVCEHNCQSQDHQEGVNCFVGSQRAHERDRKHKLKGLDIDTLQEHQQKEKQVGNASLQNLHPQFEEEHFFPFIFFLAHFVLPHFVLHTFLKDPIHMLGIELGVLEKVDSQGGFLLRFHEVGVGVFARPLMLEVAGKIFENLFVLLQFHLKFVRVKVREKVEQIYI